MASTLQEYSNERIPSGASSLFFRLACILSSTSTQGVFGPVLYEPVDACSVGSCENRVAEYLVR